MYIRTARYKSHISYNIRNRTILAHCNDVKISVMESQTTGVSVVYSTVGSGKDQENIKAPRHWPWRGEFTGSNSPHKRPVTQKMFSFHDVIMCFWRNSYISSTRFVLGLLCCGLPSVDVAHIFQDYFFGTWLICEGSKPGWYRSHGWIAWIHAKWWYNHNKY